MRSPAVPGVGLDPHAIERLLRANRYLVLGTADDTGAPWVSPVFFAPLEKNALCWVSSPHSRHSQNLAARPAVAITVFDSTVEIGHADAVYFDAHATTLRPEQAPAALDALNRRLPIQKHLTLEDLAPHGPMVAYRADIQHRYLLVRGGDPLIGNPQDVTVEV